MSNLSVETIRQIFHTIVNARAKKTKNEETERLKQLAGINEAPLEFGKSFKQRAKDKIGQAADKAKGVAKDLKRNVSDPLLRKQGAVDYESVFDAWENSGKPKRTQEIIGLLQQLGFSDKEIKSAFRAVGVTSQGETEVISKLARGIKQRGLDKQVLRYMGEKGIEESILNEAAITNKQIKQVFQQIAELLPEKPNANEEQLYGRRRKQ